MPDINDIIELINHIQEIQQDQYDDQNYTEITIATDGTENWTFQTGDNSFHGPCYGLPYWAVQWVSQDSEPKELAQDLLNQLEELI